MHRWLLLLASFACNTRPAPVPAPPAASSGLARAAVTPAAELPPSENPLLQHALPTEQQTWLEGTVEEAIPAGGYIYLRITPPDRPPLWVVSLAITTPATRHVRVLVLGRAEHFSSRRLARDFSPLLFGAVRAAPEAPTASKGTAS